MAHPVVIMSYDKSPAITAAVAALEEAGMDVIVLNTKTAKLVNFLGALAGTADGDDPDSLPPVDDEETPDATADTDADVDADVAADTDTDAAGSEADLPADDDTAEADIGADEDEVDENGDPVPKKKKKAEDAVQDDSLPPDPTSEGLIEGEVVKLVIVEGDGPPILYPSTISAGARTTYTLNESAFSFWPGSLSDEPIRGSVNIEVNEHETFTSVIFSDTQTCTPPELHVSQQFLDEMMWRVGDKVEVKASAQDAYGEPGTIEEVKDGKFQVKLKDRTDWVYAKDLMKARKE